MGLLLVGFIGGLLTGISPCIIPVLPVIFFSGGTEAARPIGEAGKPIGGRRPYLVMLGLVVSFSFFTLAGSFLLSLLHLPQSTIIWIGIVFLVLIGIGLIVPRFERVLEKPFSWIPQRQASGDHGGFLLGIALGAVFVPCAGPVLAVVAVAGAKGAISADTLFETLAFAIGVAMPLLVFALAGRRLAERVRAFRRHQRGIRVTAGIVMIALAIAVVPVFNVPTLLLQAIPDYTSKLQAATSGIGSSVGFGSAKTTSGTTSASSGSTACTAGASTLVECGAAPEFTGIDQWFNTANDKPITLKSLRGKVVLIDFWAYSCINCQRSTPHLNAWYKSYQKDGFVIVGVHAPEYAFEHVAANVLASAKQQGIEYPIALDNEFDTWTAYDNQYWPAEYLIDAKGQVRHIAFGEGDYGTTEKLIRTLLTDAHPSSHAAARHGCRRHDTHRDAHSRDLPRFGAGDGGQLQQPIRLPGGHGDLHVPGRRARAERLRVQRPVDRRRGVDHCRGRRLRHPAALRGESRLPQRQRNGNPHGHRLRRHAHHRRIGNPEHPRPGRARRGLSKRNPDGDRQRGHQRVLVHLRIVVGERP